jgi:hypothetical protein
LTASFASLTNTVASVTKTVDSLTNAVDSLAKTFNTFELEQYHLSLGLVPAGLLLKSNQLGLARLCQLSLRRDNVASF